MPIVWDLQMQWAMGLYHAVTGSLCHWVEHVVLEVAGLHGLSICANKRQVLALLVFETNFPPVKKLWPGMNVGQLLVLEWSLEFAAHDIFQAVVRDDMMVCALVLYGYGLLHQASLFELVTVDQRTTKSTLLIWIEALSEVFVHLGSGIRISSVGSLESGILILVIRCIGVVPSLSDGGSHAFLPLPLCTARWVESRLLLFRLQSSHKLSVNETVIHHPTRRPVNCISPAFDSGRVLLVHQDSPGGQHFCALFVVRASAYVA